METASDVETRTRMGAAAGAAAGGMLAKDRNVG